MKWEWRSFGIGNKNNSQNNCTFWLLQEWKKNLIIIITLKQKSKKIITKKKKTQIMSFSDQCSQERRKNHTRKWNSTYSADRTLNYEPSSNTTVSPWVVPRRDQNRFRITLLTGTRKPLTPFIRRCILRVFSHTTHRKDPRGRAVKPRFHYCVLICRDVSGQNFYENMKVT